MMNKILRNKCNGKIFHASEVEANNGRKYYIVVDINTYETVAHEKSIFENEIIKDYEVVLDLDCQYESGVIKWTSEEHF